MVDPVSSARLAYQALYVGIAVAILFVGMLPLSAVPPSIPGPDLLICLTLAWVLRRPDFLPVTAVVAVVLLEDLLTMRPPGLWPLIVLAGTEFLRSRAGLTRDLPFLLEWAMVAVVLLAMLVLNRLALIVFMVPDVAFGAVLMQAVMTLLAYPVVVAALHYALGLRKMAPGEVDALGHRL